LALFRELAGIAQEIEQNLLEAHGVRVECTRVLLGFDNEAILILFGKLPCGANDLVDEPCQIDRLGIEFELSGFNFGKVQYLIDEAQEVGPGCIYPAQRFLLARNCDLCSLATASWRLLSSISLNNLAFWIASTDCAAKVCS